LQGGAIDRAIGRVLVGPVPMRRLLHPVVFSLIFALQPGSLALAQDAGTPGAAEPAEPPPATPAPAGAEPAPAADAPAAPPPAPAPAPEGEGEGEPADTTLTPPQLAPLDLGGPGAPEDATLPDPSEAARQLEAAAPPAPPEKKGWTASETVFHLHGYLRMRGTLLKEPWLGHTPRLDRLPAEGRTNYDPFSQFSPRDRVDFDATDTTDPVKGGCGNSYSDGDGRCRKQTLVSADMRLRLKPEIHLSDDVRVKAWIDLMDNVGLGTTGYGPNEFETRSAIKVRRAWGEARNRDIGELRFGRMGADWGLGILDNGGDRNGIDSDFSSDVDRIMGITNLAGFYLMAAYDWASEGDVLPGSATPSGVPIDRAQSDDHDAITVAVAHKLEPEAQQGALLRGESVFNYGAYFIYRDQLLQRNFEVDSTDRDGDGDKDDRVPSETQPYARFDQTQYIPDLWLQFLWEGLRLELEAAYVAGALEGGCPVLKGTNNEYFKDASEVPASQPGGGTNERSATGRCKFRQLGVALELEYRLFDEKLGIHFASGLATGDANARGLAATNDPSLQRARNEDDANDTISTFQFHPDYRVDLLLWRTLMRRVAGAYYFKPGVSYDFIRDPYGQQAGGRFDVIYSRASSPKQAWGQSGNLGLELDVSLYYRSEDGPDILDGFYGLVQWGVLFPFKGLGYDSDIANTPKSQNAMIFRGMAGIQF
jgi:uncharacterized protein (TIGR04551 family)